MAVETRYISGKFYSLYATRRTKRDAKKVENKLKKVGKPYLITEETRLTAKGKRSKVYFIWLGRKPKK